MSDSPTLNDSVFRFELNSRTKSLFSTSLMSPIHITLITALGLVGIFYNLRMLLSCLKNKAKYTFLQNTWPVVICQTGYHVTVLIMNTVDAWTRLDEQRVLYCSVVYVLVSTVMTFFVGGNLMAILAMESRNTLGSVDQSRDPFSTCTLFRTVVLALGLSVAVILRYFICFHQQLAFYVMNISAIVVVTIIVLLLVTCGSSVSSLNLDHIPPKLPMPGTPFLTRCKKNKGIVLFVVLFLICTGLAVTNAFSTLAFQALSYLLIMNAVVGIALPVTFGDFIDSSSELEDEMKTVVYI